MKLYEEEQLNKGLSTALGYFLCSCPLHLHWHHETKGHFRYFRNSRRHTKFNSETAQNHELKTARHLRKHGEIRK